MARTKHGVFSWEDVLVQRYQSNKPPPLRHHQFIEAADPQQSPLLARLSPELRLIIWNFVLADQRIHIIQLTRQRLGHVVCPCPLDTPQTPGPSSSLIFCDICHGTGIPQPARETDLHRVNKTNLLGLALTCRQIYHESIALLYTLPTLEFSNPWTLPYFLPTIPHEHLTRIRTLELRWSFPGHWLPSKDSVRAVYVSAGRAQWTETCLALSRLVSLRSFVLVLESNWFSEPVERLVGFLEPLRGAIIGGRDWGRTATMPERERQWKLENESSGSFSSDEESCGSFGSGSSCWGGRMKTTRGGCAGKWELRLQGQSYYVHEVERIGEDLRRRGIDCWVAAV